MIVVCLLFRVHRLLAVSNPELRHDRRHQGSKTTQQHAYRWAKTSYFNVRTPGDFKTLFMLLFQLVHDFFTSNGERIPDTLCHVRPGHWNGKTVSLSISLRGIERKDI